jgi:hypothetical protein
MCKNSYFLRGICKTRIFSIPLRRNNAETTLKAKFSIFSVAIAALLLVAFTAVPHHHHGAMMCMAAAHHEDAHDRDANHDADHACSTHRCAADDDAAADGYCAAELEYLVSAQQEINCHHFSCTLHHPPFPLLPALFVWVKLEADVAATPGEKHKYRPAALLSESAGTGQIHGLRAPPVRLTKNG